MKYTEILEMLKLEGAKPLPVWEVFTGDGWYKNNGYVTIPDTLPFDYLDKHYRILDLTPIHSMTYEGYAWVTALGEIQKSRGAVYLKRKLQEYDATDKAIKDGQMKLGDFTSFLTVNVVVFVATDGDDYDSKLDGKRYKARRHEEFFPDADELTETDYDLTIKTFRPEEHEDFGGRCTYIAVYAG